MRGELRNSLRACLDPASSWGTCRQRRGSPSRGRHSECPSGGWPANRDQWNPADWAGSEFRVRAARSPAPDRSGCRGTGRRSSCSMDSVARACPQRPSAWAAVRGPCSRWAGVAACRRSSDSWAPSDPDHEEHSFAAPSDPCLEDLRDKKGQRGGTGQDGGACEQRHTCMPAVLPVAWQTGTGSRDRRVSRVRRVRRVRRV